MLSLLTHTRRAVCLLIAAAGCSAAEAPLTLAVAVEQTLARNPDLQRFMFRLRAQAARVESAGLKPPLEFRAEVEDAFGTGRTSGVGVAEASFSLSQVIELGNKRGYRVDAAQSGSRLIEIERAAAQLDVLAEVTRRFIHVVADQEHLQLTQSATRLAEETVTAAQTRVAAARAPEVEVRRARITLARAQIEQEHAEHELMSSRRKLTAMWGESEPGFGAVEADLYSLHPAEPFEALAARLERNPDFVRFASERRLRDAEIRLAQSQARSNIAVSAGIKQLQQSHDQALIFGVTVPLFNARRAHGAVDEAAALRDQTDAELAAHRVRAEAQLFELYQELQHAITEVEVVRTNVLPEMQAALEATRFAFERGRYSYLEWVDAQHELVEVQRGLIEASANAHLYRAEIERLTGEPL